MSPDPEKVREIARTAVRYIATDEALARLVTAAMAEHAVPDADVYAWSAVYNRSYMAVVDGQIDLSWPDEQPQDEGDGEQSEPIVATVSGVCICPTCEAVGRSIYRMVGTCLNCHPGSILMLFRTGDQTSTLDCPFCGCKDVRALRRATDDEIPAAELNAREGGEEA